MVIFSYPKFEKGKNFSSNRFIIIACYFSFNLFNYIFLFLILKENNRPVLWTNIGTLTIYLRGILGSKINFDQSFKTHHFWIIYNFNSLGMSCGTGIA